ncbi:MAG: ABC transporter permease, partial [Lachnospiraceae bacterium]|nr:ABC transporter permease [Lachnospiraceae bacterium]
MEYRRAHVMLPSILHRAVILAAVCLAAVGVIAFCVGVFQGKNPDRQKLRIGYTAQENKMTNLAVAYVQGMESFQSLCSLEAVAEQEGKQMLESGELSALVVLPEDVVNEILSGSNTPATLYLPGEGGRAASGGAGAVGSLLFEELAAAAMGMLGTAQAEIYASGALLQKLAETYGAEAVLSGNDILQGMYDDINQFNLAAAAGREAQFQVKTLSLTENDTYAVYYGSAFLTVYVMLGGLFLGGYCKRSSLQQTMADRRVGVGYAVQLGARCLSGARLMLVVTLLPFLAFVIPQVREVLSVAISFKGMFCLIFIIYFMTIYYMFLYQIVEKRESALVVIGAAAVIQAYLSGCLIPSVLLPVAVRAVGRLLPASMVKQGFTILFTGNDQVFSYVAAGLFAWGALLYLCTVLSMRLGERNRSAADRLQASARTYRIPSLGMVLLRRLLRRKSMWFSLGFVAVLSAVILQMEQRSDIQIRAAVYDASGEYEALLGAYEGVVAFELCGSDEAVRRAVLRGEAECGYVLPETLGEDMKALRAKREILVYQRADAVAVPVVNEILFERIFRRVSFDWFADYLAQQPAVTASGVDAKALRALAAECFDGELLAGTTFRLEIRRLDPRDAGVPPQDSAEQDARQRTMYPVYLVAAVAVGLCVLQGAVQVVTDVRDKNFYKRSRLAVSALTLLLPTALGLLCALVILGTARW